MRYFKAKVRINENGFLHQRTATKSFSSSFVSSRALMSSMTPSEPPPPELFLPPRAQVLLTRRTIENTKRQAWGDVQLLQVQFLEVFMVHTQSCTTLNRVKGQDEHLRY